MGYFDFLTNKAAKKREKEFEQDVQSIKQFSGKKYQQAKQAVKEFPETEAGRFSGYQLKGTIPVKRPKVGKLKFRGRKSVRPTPQGNYFLEQGGRTLI